MGSSLPTIVVAALATLLGGPGEPLARWSFEHDADEWQSRGSRIERTDLKAGDGGWSLKIDVRFPNPAAISRPARLDVDLVGEIVYHVFVPADAPESIKTLLFLKDKNGLWFEHLFERPLRPGAWTRVDVDTSASSPHLRPCGHHQVWSSVGAHRIREIGIRLFCDDAYEGSLYIDHVVVGAASAALPPLRVISLRENRLEVGRYEKFEIAFDINRPTANPFDPEEIRIDATFIDPRGTVSIVPAFYYQEFVRRLENGRERLIPVGPGGWKVRFAPVALGPHSYFLTVVHNPGEPANGEPEPFVTGRRSFACVPSQSRGFIRVSEEDPLYFEFASGEWFYPIGHNLHAPSDASPRAQAIQRAIDAEPLPDRGTFSYDLLFRKMAEHGENFAEIWMAAWGLGLEWLDDLQGYHGLTRYNLGNAWKLDCLLDLAKKHDLYLHLVLDNHGKVSTWCDAEWHDNPYNTQNGGFLDSPEDFFRDPVARELYKKKLRYIVARWAYSTRIAGLELWSEIDLVGDSWDFHAREELAAPKVQWHAEMTDYLAQLDPWSHPVTTHFSTDHRRIKAYLATLPGIAYLACDAYKLRDRPIVDLILKTARTFSAYAKPGFVTEYGGKPFGEQSIPGLRADLHAGLWATYMTHAAGTPLLWWFQFIDSDDGGSPRPAQSLPASGKLEPTGPPVGLYWNFKALAAFHKGEDRRGKGLEPRPVAFPVGHPDLAALSLASDRMAYAWLYSKRAMEHMPEREDAPVFNGITIRLSGFKQGNYRVEVWDTFEGEVAATLQVAASAGKLHIPLPAFRTDCALKIKPASDTPGGL